MITLQLSATVFRVPKMRFKNDINLNLMATRASGSVVVNGTKADKRKRMLYFQFSEMIKIRL